MTAEPTRDQIRAGIDAQICPWCNAGPFKILASHTTRLHGVDRFQLRDLAGFTYSTSICDPDTAADRREIARETSHRLNPPAKGAKRVLSEAAKEIARQKLAAVRSEEQRRAATVAAHQPEAKAKRAASLRETWDARRGYELDHGDYRRYKNGCRCEECKAANAEHSRARRATFCLGCGHAADDHNGRVGNCRAQGCGCRRRRTTAMAER